MENELKAALIQMTDTISSLVNEVGSLSARTIGMASPDEVGASRIRHLELIQKIDALRSELKKA
jgi:hypothetical protein